MADTSNWRCNEYDFSSIQKTITKYFPVDKPSQYNEENLNDFKGVKEIGDILNENFFVTKNYKERWAKFKKFLKQELKKPINESMIAFYPCYSGFVVIKKETNDKLTYTKELHFFVSLLGPYYTILGIDKVEIVLHELSPMFNLGEELLNRPFNAVLAITVSPYLEFQEPFEELQQGILKYLPTLKFIPYNINRKKIEGISLLYPDSEAKVKDSVFSALFRPDKLFNSEIRGDKHFGFDEWSIVKKLNKSRIDEIKESLSKKALKAKSETTIHKVWKCESITRVIGKSKIGNLMFWMHPIQVLDFSDQYFARIISKEDEEPVISKYSLVDNEIVIDILKDHLRFRISEMNNMQLTLIVHVDINHDAKKAIKGDMLEMIFEEFK